MPQQTGNQKNAKQRLIESATNLFCKHGYSAVTVRQICTEADVGVNMVSYYFDGKAGLYKEIISTFSEEVFMSPLKTLSQAFDSKAQFVKILEIFINQTLDGLIAQRRQYTLVRREKIVSSSMMKYQQGMIEFFERAKHQNIVRKQLDSAMVTGLITGRLADQVEDADWIKKVTGVDIISDTEYRQRWVSANLDIFIHGLAIK